MLSRFTNIRFLSPPSCVGFHYSKAFSGEPERLLFAVISSVTHIVSGNSRGGGGFHGNQFFQMHEIDPLVMYGFRKVCRSLLMKTGGSGLPNPTVVDGEDGSSEEDEEGVGGHGVAGGVGSGAAAAAPVTRPDGFLVVNVRVCG